jgi:hypothetical protein
LYVRSPLLDEYPYLPQFKETDSEPVKEPTPPPVEEERPYKRAKVLEEPTINWLPTTASASSERVWKMPGLDNWVLPQPPEPPKKLAIEAIIAAARATAVAAALQKAEEEAKEIAKAEEKAKLIEKKQEKKEKEKKKPSLNKEEKEALREKKLKKMVGAVVVKTMGRYQKYMDHDQFKKYAKEVRRLYLHSLLPLLTVHCLADGTHR